MKKVEWYQTGTPEPPTDKQRENRTARGEPMSSRWI